MAAHNAAATRALGTNAPQLEYFEGAFSLSSPVGFRVLELDRLAYILCGMSTTRHAVQFFKFLIILLARGTGYQTSGNTSTT